MKKALINLFVLFLLSVSNVFADDVSIDSSGNVKTGVSNANAEFEVTGGSGEGGILGSASGTGASGVYGINTTYGNYGILGYDSYGVFGYSLAGWAGYFQGNARVTGNLTVDGTVSGPNIGDITAINAGTGLTGGASSGSTTLNANTTYLQRRVSTSCTVGSSIRVINEDGTVLCETDDAGLTSESDPKVGSNTTNYIPKWNGSALVTGSINDNGNIGIGTSSTSADKLKIVVLGGASQDHAIRTAIERTTGNNIAVNGSASGAGATKNVGLYGWASGATTNWGLHIDSGDAIFDGNVGIGTTTPSQKLTVAGTIESTTGGIKFPDGTIQSTAIRSEITCPCWTESDILNFIYNHAADCRTVINAGPFDDACTSNSYFSGLGDGTTLFFGVSEYVDYGVECGGGFCQGCSGQQMWHCFFPPGTSISEEEYAACSVDVLRSRVFGGCIE